MADHGLLFKVGDDHGPDLRVQLDDVALLVRLLGEAPGGARESPTAHEAQRTLELALQRAEEVRHWVLSDRACGEILWAISRYSKDRPIPDGLRPLRDVLTDYDARKYG